MRSVFIFMIVLFLGSLPAQAITCSRATTLDDKTICQDTELKSLDEELNATFKMVLQFAEQNDIPKIKLAQFIWLREKRSCDGDKDCLTRQMSQRLRFLRGKPQAGSNTTAKLAPIFLAAEDHDWYVGEALRFFDPKQTYQIKWNKHVDEQIDAVFSFDGFANYEHDIEPGQSSSASFATSISDVSYFSETLFSGYSIITSYESGAAHPNDDQISLNLHVDTGEPIFFDELFLPGADLKVIALCEKKSTEGTGLSDEDRKILATIVLDLDYWQLNEASAEITFPRLSIEGVGYCSLTKSELSAFVRPAFGIWQ